MSKKRAPGRFLDEWMELVTECRQSGLTDAAWCNEHGISPSCFYNAVTRLRKKTCQIPDPAPKDSSLDLTSHKQDYRWRNCVSISFGTDSWYRKDRADKISPNKKYIIPVLGDKRINDVTTDELIKILKETEIPDTQNFPMEEYSMLCDAVSSFFRNAMEL